MKRTNSTRPAAGQPSGVRRAGAACGIAAALSAGVRPLVAVVCVVEALEVARPLAEVGERSEALLGRKKRLSKVSLKCSTVPFRHGSRAGMKRGVAPWWRQKRTIRPSPLGNEGPPLSSWSRSGRPSYAQSELTRTLTEVR